MNREKLFTIMSGTSLSDRKNRAISGDAEAAPTKATVQTITDTVLSCAITRRSNSRIWRTAVPMPNSASMLVIPAKYPAISANPKSEGDSSRAEMKTEAQVRA